MESIIEPSKVISDQYESAIITLTDGRNIHGRIINLNGNNIKVNTDMLNPNGLVDVDTRTIESTARSKVSMMPEGLIDNLRRDEILDLMAYLLSRGDRNNKMFTK